MMVNDYTVYHKHLPIMYEMIGTLLVNIQPSPFGALSVGCGLVVSFHLHVPLEVDGSKVSISGL